MDEIKLLTRTDAGGTRRLAAASIAGTVYEWPVEGLEAEYSNGNGNINPQRGYNSILRLRYQGEVYLPCRSLGSRRLEGGESASGMAYRRAKGLYQVFATWRGDGYHYGPMLRPPVETREEAEAAKARDYPQAAYIVVQHDGTDWQPVSDDKEPESAPTPSGSEGSTVTAETDQDNSTTEPAGTQAHGVIALTVRYVSESAAVQPQQVFTHGQLVNAVDAEGNPVKLPRQSLPENRLALKEAGYRPDFPRWRWLDSGPPPRRRLEVWVLVDGDGLQDARTATPDLCAAPKSERERLADERLARLPLWMQPTPEGNVAKSLRMKELHGEGNPHNAEPFRRNNATKQRMWDTSRI